MSQDPTYALKAIIEGMHWMARRYADGRSTYAPSRLNEMTRTALALGVELRDPYFARDGMGRKFDGLTEEETRAAEEDMPRAFQQHVDETTERKQKLVNALAESLKLQSHYASLLNDYDGGKRMQFSSVKEWLERLEDLKREGGAQ